MGIASTIIAVIFIVAIAAGAVYFLWATKDKNKPMYMAPAPKQKMTKEEKAAAKEDKKSAKAAAKEAKKK